ncbi:MAG: CDP-glucose 4,6-dehydratase [Flavobacteriaceae bacterium]|nr:CDP-glucose 4,6-dehydratase [Flavobacteriaceae bacterium]
MGLINALNQFKNKKIFITGHTGFKGSWLTFLLDHYGAITRGYALKPKTNPSLYLKLTFSKKHSSIYADINDFNRLQKEVISFKPDFIFHLAAQPIVLQSYEDPRTTFNTNFNGTLNLLEVLRNGALSCTAIFITTDKVYENKELNIAFSEEDKLGGNDPYSASKAACEILIHSYQRSFFKDSKINIASVRAGNVIGGGDWSENRLIPDIIHSVFNKKPLEIRNLKATRPWQHVLEPLYGYLMLATALSKNPSIYSTAWNFGPEIEDVKTVKEIIQIAKTFDFQIKMQSVKNVKKQEAKYLSLNIDKVKQKLNWNPKWNSELAIQKTLNWYQKFYQGETANKLIEENLKMYNNI